MARKSGKHKSKRVVLAERMIMAMNYTSNIAVGIERVVDLSTLDDDGRIAYQKERIPFIVITAHGLEHESMSREMFLKEFNRDLLYEEWAALLKLREIAMEKDSNSEQAIALWERMFEMKLKELEGKEMAELVSMHNELAKAAGKPEVEKFKSVEAAKIAILQLANKTTTAAKPKTKSAAKATGKGQDGRPRTGVGKFAKDLLAKGKGNAEVLEAVKKEFPKNSTTLSCIAYYRAHMVKDGLLAKSAAKPKAKADGKKGKESKAAKKPAAKKEAKPATPPAAATAPAAAS